MVRLAALSPVLFALLPALPGLPKRDEVDALKLELRDDHKWTRQDAVEKLGAIGTLEAWELVVDALDDRAGEVADTAQWALGGVRDEEALELVLGDEGLGSRDDWVRRRVAEALGRMEVAIEGRDWDRALGDREAEVRRALAASLARRGAEGIAEDVERVAEALERQAERDRDPRAAGEAWMALAAVDAERARAAWADARPTRLEPAARCGALRAAETLGIDVAAIAAMARAPSRAVRMDAADALARRGTRAAARALVELLAAEEEGRPARRIAGLLRELSGLKYRTDPRPWRDWAARLPEDWRPERGSAGPDDFGERTVALAGLPIRSGRIAFLIDLSGSMWMEREDGKTRKQAVDVQLERCLTSLPETTRFNLIPYVDEPVPWRRGLVDATSANTRAAARWFADIGEQRKPGNFWAAYVLALEDPEVDTIVMLGDGEPTGGPRYVLELLPDVVARENLGRGVTIDSIIVGSRARRTHAAWERIAEESGGTSLVVDL